MNKDNIVNAIPRVYIKTQKSPKTGNEFTRMYIEFMNGYVYKAFVNDEQKFAINDAVIRSQSNNMPEPGTPENSAFFSR